MPSTPSHSGGSEPPTELSTLTKRAAAGDSGAFEALFRRLGPAIHRMLLNRVGGDSHRADDLSQRTWAGLWRSLQSGNYDPERSAISTYVYAVAYRTWLHDVRQTRTAAGVRGVDHFEDLQAVGSSPEPDAATHLSQAIDAVRSALAGREVELGDDERDLLRAIAAGESDRAIAKRLGLAASTVNVRKQSALTKLRRILARQGFRSESSEREAAPGKQPDEP